MKITFLGTGTSTGIPQIGCQCRTCTSADPRDKRTRASILVEEQDRRLLIDCGPDFRQQILRLGSPDIDALLVTHSHYDHVGGIDDLRPYCYRHENGLPLYCSADVERDLRNRLPYCFASTLYPGVPTFSISRLVPGQKVTLTDRRIEVLPLTVMHGRLPILGFRIGSFAYITDALTLPPETIESLRHLDLLVINALRHKTHMSHMNLRQALDVIDSVKPRKALLTHLSHDMGPHAETVPLLPSGIDIATDGLCVEI